MSRYLVGAAVARRREKGAQGKKEEKKGRIYLFLKEGASAVAFLLCSKL